MSNILNMRLNKERQCPSFFSKLLICSFQLHFASVVTPRYFNEGMWSIFVPFGCNLKSSNKESILLLPTSIGLVFLTFMVNLLSVYVPISYFSEFTFQSNLKFLTCWCATKENSIICIQNHRGLFNSIWQAINVHIK